MGIKSRIEQKKEQIELKAMDTQHLLASIAGQRYINWLMKEEKCDKEEAVAIVEGRTDPLEPKYMLGFKLADPVVMIAIFKQHGKNNRLSAARNFAATLTEEERILFWNEVFDEKNAKQFKQKYKKEAKKKGLKDDPEDTDQAVQS